MSGLVYLAAAVISLIGLGLILAWLIRRVARASQPLPRGIRSLLQHRQSLIEVSLILMWAMWVGQAYFNFDPQAWPFGSEFGLSVQSYFAWQNLTQCGDCAFWNGALNGGAPTLVELHGAIAHPLVVIPTVLWGAINGLKIAIVGSLAMAGVAQWWLAKVLGLGMWSRLWSAALAVVGGHLAGRLSNGVIGLVISTAACSLMIAPAIELSLTGRRRATVKLGLTLGLALLAGQGYLQIAAVVCLLPAGLIFAIGRGTGRSVLKETMLAGVLALLLAATLIVPLAHFWPNFAKDVDLTFSTAQPLEYVPLNLVIRDAEFLSSPQLHKAPLGYLYAAFIGWTPILLSLAAMRLAPRAQRRRLVYFAVTIGALILMASALPLKVLRDALSLNFLAAVRYPALMLGLAVPLILGLAAWGLDLCLAQLGLLVERIGRRRAVRWAAAGAIGLASGAIGWASIQIVYDYSEPYLGLVPAPKNTDQIIQELRTSTAQWVNPPYGEGYWPPLALAAGLKINVWRPWSWLGRDNPPAYFSASRFTADASAPTYVKTLLGVNILQDAANEYARIDSAAGPLPCQATSVGGHLDVVCDSAVPGTLIVHENNWAGWTVRRNGQSVALGQGRWLTTDAPAGLSRFEFRYQPWDVPAGATLTICGLLLAGYWWFKADNQQGKTGL